VTSEPFAHGYDCSPWGHRMRAVRFPEARTLISDPEACVMLDPDDALHATEWIEAEMSRR
jgi:hypothetical protein